MTTAKVDRLRAGLYTRVSADSSGEGRSPAEQEDLGRLDCDRQGMDVVAVYTDNDRSASGYATKAREDMEKCKADIVAGRLDILVAYASSRLQRDVKHYVELRELCRAHGVLWRYNGRTFDFRNSSDRFSTTIDAAVDAKLSDDISDAVHRAFDANRKRGRVHGVRQYGYLRLYGDDRRPTGKQIPHPTEAPAVKLMFRLIAKGETLREVARVLNAKGYRLKNGELWTGPRVRGQVLNRPGYLGHLVHGGEIVKHDCWPALVDVEIYDTVQAVLTGRKVARSTAVAHLLSGIIRCGKCDGAVRGIGKGYLVCKGHRHGADGAPKGCVSRNEAKVDAAVERAIVQRFGVPGALDLLTGAGADEIEAATTQLAALVAEMAEADADLDAGEISARTHSRVEARCLPLIAELEAASAAARVDVPRQVVDLAKAPDTAAHWNAYDLTDKRAVIVAVMTDLRLLPAATAEKWTRGGVGISWSWTGDVTGETHTVA